MAPIKTWSSAGGITPTLKPARPASRKSRLLTWPASLPSGPASPVVSPVILASKAPDTCPQALSVREGMACPRLVAS